MQDRSVHTEDAIIQEFLAPLAAGFPGAFGLKDDCAVIAPSPGHEFVLKTDPVAAGVHFLADDPPADIGWKSLAVNVSDLAAKGARPVGYLLALSFPEAPQRDWLAEFARGLGEAQTRFGMHLLGGDTDRRPGPISITPTVIGEVPGGRMVRRGAARAGDIVFVSGTIGDASLGLALHKSPSQATHWSLSPDQTETLESRYLRPMPRLPLAPAVLHHARASMDLSDGLLKDLGRMCSASLVGADIEYERLPVSAAMRAVRAAAPDAAAAALFAGDDYEILAAVPAAAADEFASESAAAGIPVTRIGQFGAAPGVRLLDAGLNPMPTTQSGWDHFGSSR